MKAIVIDDEKKTRELIANMVMGFNDSLEILPIGENVKSGIEAIKKHKPNLVFLDIQMPDGSGFDVLKAFPNKDFEVIFITAHEEFAIKAIKYSALDYILKPIDPEELEAAVNKAISQFDLPKSDEQFETLAHNLQQPQKKRLVLKTQESAHILELDNIIRCESDRNYTSFFLNEGKTIVVSKTLKEYENLICGKQFMRVQQSHIINLNYVDRFDKANGGSVVMKDGTELPISPSKRDLFFELLENL